MTPRPRKSATRPALTPTRDALYGRVRQIVESARTTAARSVNTAQVVSNWLVGREIVEEEQRGEERAEYGERIIAMLAERLRTDFGTGYSALNLALMKRFYLLYQNLIQDAPPQAQLVGTQDNSDIFYALRKKSAQPSKNQTDTDGTSFSAPPSWQPGQLNPNLSWTHYRTLLRVARPEARAFYEIESARQAWSARELERQIDSVLYERLAKSRSKSSLLKLASEGLAVSEPADIFKDPVVIEFLGLPESERLVETNLEQALINNLQTFLLELGRGFAFVARQQRLTLDGDHFYIDLFFYHAILKCYVLIDLKVGKLTHQDLGQMQFYVNYFDRERRTEGDNPTIGLILASNKNDAVVRYTLGEQQEQTIFASRYQLHLPTEAELADELRREAHLFSPPPTKPRKRAMK